MLTAFARTSALRMSRSIVSSSTTPLRSSALQQQQWRAIPSSSLQSSQLLHTSTRNAFKSSFTSRAGTPVPGEHPQEQPIVQRKLPITKRLWMVGKPGYIKWPIRAIYAVIFSTVTLLGGILIWDATTYRTRYLDGVPVNPLALNPRRGGPKNLKICEFMVGDEETDVSNVSLVQLPVLY